MLKYFAVYILPALLLVTTIGGLTYAIHQLSHQENSATVINISGRQRMLSQKITKIALLIKINKIHDIENSTNYKELNRSLDQWAASHNELISGKLGQENSEVVSNMLNQIEYVHNQMLEAGYAIVRDQDIQKHIQVILDDESSFLSQMDAIVNQYTKETDQKLETTRRSLLAWCFGEMAMGIAYMVTYRYR